jgi:hypothetical protein
MDQPGNRRDLMADLTRALAPGSDERLFAVVRLHGLTERRAADELLSIVRRRFVLDVGRFGRVYLTRWDELCLLFDCPLETAIQLLDDTTEVLNRLASVDAEAGVALLPEEAADPISALERADRRINPASYSRGEGGVMARRERRGLVQPEMIRLVS